MDYRSFRGGQPSANLGYWWSESDKPHERVWQAGKYLEEQQAYRSADNLRHARLYGNFDAIGFGLRDYSRSSSGPNYSRIALNVIASCVDTLTAKIAKNRPRPSFQTFGGDWEQLRRAKGLNKFLQGSFHEAKTYRHGVNAFRDSCIFGTGIIKSYVQDGRICDERVFPDELLVDDADGVYSEPRQMFQRKAVAREVLLGLYGDNADAKDAIENAHRTDDLDASGRGFGDLVEVFEAWHLPSYEGAGDGRHVIAIDKATLLDEEWKLNRFPFSFIRFVDRVVGFWGQGLAERATGIQIEINRLLREISDTLRLASKGRVFLENGSKVVKSHLNNEIGTIITYTGTPPIFSAANMVPPEVFQQLDRLWTRAFEETGISQLSSQGKKPAGLDAAVALREMNDIESERFVIQGQRFENLFLDIGHMHVELAKQIAEDDGDYEVRAPSRKLVELVKWKDVKLDDDKYVMQCFPVSSLPTTPAARRQELMEWVNAGWTDSVTAMQMMDIPDTENVSNVAVAAIEDADWTIQQILDGDYRPPDEFQNLELLRQRSVAAYLNARRDKAPQDVLENLQTFIQQTSDLIAAMAPPPQQAMPQDAMQPPEAMPPVPQ